jgi:cytochrome c nitrite reductase small subunit
MTIKEDGLIKKFLRALTPPPKWQLAVSIAGGALVGALLMIFQISNASSYLSDSPETCINCHIMRPEYLTWQHSSHKSVTNCNDCHVPHNNIINKYYFKARDGMRHATIFTLRTEPQVINIGEAGKAVVQENCIRCHIRLINPVSISSVNGRNYKYGEGKLCWQCHREVPHGRVHSLSSTPAGITPQLKTVVPDWLYKQNKK